MLKRPQKICQVRNFVRFIQRKCVISLPKNKICDKDWDEIRGAETHHSHMVTRDPKMVSDRGFQYMHKK